MAEIDYDEEKLRITLDFESRDEFYKYAYKIGIKD